MKNKTNPGLKIICLNRKASFNYFFEDLYEAGLILKGSEIKSVRNGKANISDAYAIERDGEIYLINSHQKLPRDEHRCLDYPLHRELQVFRHQTKQ